MRGRIRVNDSRSNTRDKKRTVVVDMVHDKDDVRSEASKMR